jgi:hypothetical protein
MWLGYGTALRGKMQSLVKCPFLFFDWFGSWENTKSWNFPDNNRYIPIPVWCLPGPGRCTVICTGFLREF